MKEKMKVVYEDGNYTKVLYGKIKDDDVFITVIDAFGFETKIGKRFIISISNSGEKNER